jgi:glutamate-1-semialdehyde aminotransferase
MRAGLATLQKAERVNAHAQLETRTALFCDELNAKLQARGLPVEVTRFASIFWLHDQSAAPIRRIDQIPARPRPAFRRYLSRRFGAGRLSGAERL